MALPLLPPLSTPPSTFPQVGIIFGSPETTAGGNALKFYASQRVDVRAKEKVKSGDGKAETGIRVKAKVVKNKVAPPYR
jgi:recombination protein RecA